MKNITKIKIVSIAALAVILGSFSFGYCLPEGEIVVDADPGAVTFDRSVADTLTISTGLDKLILNFQSFNIASHETVNYIQPFSTASVLNRVTGAESTNIFGNLFANGNIILINPNGINIGASANINVASLIASTLNIADEDYLNNRYNFFKDGESAFLINRGNIIVNGGYVALLSQAVENSGAIVANLGTVVLASGEKTTLALDDLSQISVVVDEAVKEAVIGPDGQKMDSAIKNTGTISANGGKVILTAKVLNQVFDYAINNSGVIEAKSLVGHDGVVELSAEGAPIYNTGRIEAGEVKITTDSGFVNKGEIIADGSSELPNGGIVNIQAEAILQQGLISANAQEEGNAGEIALFAVTSNTLDSGSTTTARALGIIGNGGRIRIDSLNGKTLVNSLAVIDISSGSLLGNAGSLEVGAFDQLGFFGILNGRAPPWGIQATVKFTYHSSAVPPVIIITDQADYPPSGTPIISGAGFLPNQQVTINIFAPDGTQTTLTATADDQGSFSLTYTPETLLWGGYIATGSDGSRSAVTTFTDAPQIIMYTPIVLGTPIISGSSVTLMLRFSWSFLASASNGYLLQYSTDPTFTGISTNPSAGDPNTLLFPGDLPPSLTSYIIINTSPKTIQFDAPALTLNTNTAYYFRVAGSKSNGYIISRDDFTTASYRILTITADDVIKTYGTALTGSAGSTAFTSDGLISGESIGSVTIAYGTGAAATDAVAPYTDQVTPSAATGGTFNPANYIIIYEKGDITVTKAPLTITADPQSKTYGDLKDLGTTAFTTNALVPGDSVDSVTLTSTGTPVSATVGSYPIVITPDSESGTGLSNYNILYADGTLTVDPKDLTITADPQSKTYGDTVSFTGTEFTSIGLQNLETIGTVTLTSAGAVNTAPVSGSPYAITPSAATGGTFDPANYAITYADGTLTVGKADISDGISITPYDVTYNGLSHTATGSATGVLGEDLSSLLDLSGTTHTNANAYSGDTWSFTDPAGNYFDAEGTVDDNIAKAPLTVTADSTSKTEGETVTFAGTEFTTSGLLNEDSVASVTLNSDGAAAGAAAGSYSIVPSEAVGSGLSNYEIEYVNGDLTVNPAPLPPPSEPIFLPQQDLLRYLFPPLENMIGRATGVAVSPTDMITSDALAHSTFYYNPLTPSDMAAFDSAFTLGENAYQFMDQNINIQGHEGLLPLLDEIIKKKKKGNTL